MQKGPLGSAGSQPVAGVPAVVKANSFRVPRTIELATAGEARVIVKSKSGRQRIVRTFMFTSLREDDANQARKQRTRNF